VLKGRAWVKWDRTKCASFLRNVRKTYRNIRKTFENIQKLYRNVQKYSKIFKNFAGICANERAARRGHKEQKGNQSKIISNQEQPQGSSNSCSPRSSAAATSSSAAMLFRIASVRIAYCEVLPEAVMRRIPKILRYSLF
jgi:hypothetical protein